MNNNVEAVYKAKPFLKNRDKVTRHKRKQKTHANAKKRKKNTRILKHLHILEKSVNPAKSSNEGTDSLAKDRAIFDGIVPFNTLTKIKLQQKYTHNVWISSYEKMISWHNKQQFSYRRQCAHRSKFENDRIQICDLFENSYRNDFGTIKIARKSFDFDTLKDPYGDTDDDVAEDYIDESCITNKDTWIQNNKARRKHSSPASEDEEFIAFMEVSARHRMEHQKQKNEIERY